MFGQTPGHGICGELSVLLSMEGDRGMGVSESSLETSDSFRIGVNSFTRMEPSQPNLLSEVLLLDAVPLMNGVNMSGDDPFKL